MISSRTLLLFLIALNLLALAWWTGAMEPLVGSAREPGRLDSQIEPGSLRVTSIMADNGGPKGRNQAVPAVASDTAVRSGLSQNTAETQATPQSMGANADAAVSPGGAVQSNGHDAAPGQIATVGVPDKDGTVDQDLAQDSGLPTRTPDGPLTSAGDQLYQDDSEPLFPSVSVAAESGVTADMLPVTSPAIGATPSSESAAIDLTEANRDLPTASWQQKDAEAVDGLPLVSAALSGLATPNEAGYALSCAEFSSLSYIEAREVEDELAPYGVKTSLSRIDKGDFLVYIEPMSSVQLARRKYEQLKRLGVRDLHVIRAGYYRNGISLGMLRNHDLASRHKDQMSDLGVTTMRIGPVNARGSRYKIIAKALPATMDSVVSRHDVLTLLDMQPCQ